MSNNGGNLAVNCNFRYQTREMMQLLLHAFEEEATELGRRYTQLEQCCIASERSASFWKALCEHFDREMGKTRLEASNISREVEMWKYRALELTARLLESNLRGSTGAGAPDGRKKALV
jgi:hypothetical protein